MSRKEEDKYLWLRGEIYWYKRRTPKELLDRLHGQKHLTQSLKTSDIREARIKRDILEGELAKRLFDAANPDRYRFLDLVDEMSELRERDPEHWDDPLDLRELDRKGEHILLDAHATVSGCKDMHHKYGVTLREALKSWVRKFTNSRSNDAINKTKSSAEGFLKFLDMYDVQLSAITKRDVHDYIEVLEAKYAKQTVQGKISRLRSIWSYSETLGEVSGESPFNGHVYTGSDETNKKTPFTAEELAWLKANIALDDPAKRLLFELGVFTGCRLSELCNLKVKDLELADDIYTIFIEKGKTPAATRLVPLTENLGHRLQTLCDYKEPDDLILGIEDSAAASRWFSRIKTQNITKDSAKCFHSLRGMFATALQRAGVEELKAAALLGHERGSTMSYGYYSTGYQRKQLKEAYDKGVSELLW